MAENNEEINVINHLLSVEKDAVVLIDNALKEADSKTSQARNQANQQFKEEYDSFIEKMEKEYDSSFHDAQTTHQNQINEFKSKLESQTKNTNEFNKLLDKLLF